MSQPQLRKAKRFFYKIFIVASLAALPLYAILYTSYLSLTDEMPWWNALTLDLAAICLGGIVLMVYFRSFRTGKLVERLRQAGGGSIVKGTLMASFGLIATSFVMAMLSVTAFYWIASYTPYTSEISQFYEVTSNSTGGRHGRTVRLIDMRGVPVHVRFGPWTMGASGLEEGDQIHVHCKGFDTYCRVIDWSAL